MRTWLLSIGLVLSMQASATWILFGPEGIVANSICFVVNFQYQFAICHDEGISLYESATQDWTTFASDLPVIDAFYLDGNKLLVILNQNSESDGIYTFDPSTAQFEVIEFLESPHFIYYDEDLQTYYVGFRFGLMTSQDGLVWNQVEALNNCNIVDMDIYQNHYVAAQLDNLYGVWYSYDAGISWNAPSPGSPWITRFGFDHVGKLYGIFPDESYSSGLWSSSDFGETWEVEFWSVNMSCVGIDFMNSVFVGWDENPIGTEEGVANYDPASGNLNFMNTGLNNLVINEISVNPWMSAIALFCCTDSGAHINYDYIEVKEPINSVQSVVFEVYPNPVSDYITIYVNSRQNIQLDCILYDAAGRLVMKTTILSDQRNSLDLNNFLPGLYYFRATDGSENWIQKIIIQ